MVRSSHHASERQLTFPLHVPCVTPKRAERALPHAKTGDELLFHHPKALKHLSFSRIHMTCDDIARHLADLLQTSPDPESVADVLRNDVVMQKIQKHMVRRSDIAFLLQDLLRVYADMHMSKRQ